MLLILVTYNSHHVIVRRVILFGGNNVFQLQPRPEHCFSQRKLQCLTLFLMMAFLLCLPHLLAQQVCS